MIRYVVVEGTTGRIDKFGVKSPGSFPYMVVEEGYSIHQVEDEISDEDHVYWKDGLRFAPPKPNTWSEFDIPSDTWVDPFDLEKAKASHIKKVNDEIGRIRTRFITDLPGQGEIYQRKLKTAQDYLSFDPHPPATLDDFPALQAEVGLTADTPQQLAQIWLNMAYAWESIADTLETARLTAKANLDAATTLAEIETVMNTLDATLAALPEA